MLLGLGLSDGVRPCTLLHSIAANAGSRGDSAELIADRPSQTLWLSETTAAKLALIILAYMAGACFAALKVEMLARTECMICKA